MVHIPSDGFSMVVMIAVMVIGWYTKGMSATLGKIQDTLQKQGERIAKIQGHLNIEN